MTTTQRASNAQPRMIPNPLYCERCDGRGYLVADAEWEPCAIQCPDCAARRLEKRCTICGFIIDTSKAVERPTAFETRGRR